LILRYFFKGPLENTITMTNSLFSLALQSVSTESEGGLFDFNATLPLMAIQILLLMLALNLIFYKPISQVLDERDESIRKQLTEASEMLMKAESITKQYELDLAQERRDAQSIIASAQKGAQEIVAMEIKQAQKDTEQLVTEATNQLNSQKEKALKALEEQVNTLSEQIKNKLISKQLTS
jgi:F-type H+-transporting ATPase subunit b